MTIWTPKLVQERRPRIPVRLPIGVIVKARIIGRLKSKEAGDLLAYCSLARRDTKLQKDIFIGAWTWFDAARALNSGRPIRGH